MHAQARIALALVLALGPGTARAAGDVVTVLNASSVSTVHVRVYVGRYKLGERDVPPGKELAIALTGNPIDGHLIAESFRKGKLRCTFDSPIHTSVTHWRVTDEPKCVLRRR